MSLTIHKVPTVPIEGQKTGTSGLRKKTAVITGTPNYIENWLQCLFTSIGDDLKGKTLVIGGDGRYHNSAVAQTAIRIGFANGVRRFVVGKDGILSTPGVSAVIRQRGLFGGIIMTASHNPGGPNADWGIKYNCENGGPAPEKVTDQIYVLSKTIKEYSIADLDRPVDLAQLDLGGPHAKCFDFEALKRLVARPDFTMLYDGLNAVTGPYAKKVFVDELGAPAAAIVEGTPLEDFGGAHPDPNLTYAHGLVEKMDSSKNPNAPVFGAASDGDGDRNMVLGRDWFVSPSDSLAIIFDYAAQGAIPYFNKAGLPGVARSMPTSRAVDVVSKARGIPCYQTPTGWKFFGNLMDAGKVSLCGEESFGTGSNVIREKDGLFSILCWLSILAFRNQDPTKPLVGVREINEDHWRKYGRHFYTRCDYEGVESEAADRMFDHIRGKIADNSLARGVKLAEGWTVASAEEYRYVDPIDGSIAEKQGLIITFENGGRIVFRLSGTGSAGATIRLYMELFEKDFDKIASHGPLVESELMKIALRVSDLEGFTARKEPTVIT
ncbi:phosphoglucomutase, putative [Perkinsus marinus ATCC 50983]|uniref:phosphoglucomutase (alpha-D-glucose-1,6-bisphosphate-dependent) n=1 Tax=Perkinsus marinus (strain ATCC 50983 / TXsc) TaxID=423536 RepID=C5L6B9_PERM5|nr:phosphoglucomutase, putative [Perkinsus marinus ATCC 50983]EER07746.1 phosphoglucomutase, putative [Perkinsus marinus ATCC 50983]|eukprot:XP_002775930.1 phosphoglucomutase, putative [Perkinsus marinus ATCC 50983]